MSNYAWVVNGGTVAGGGSPTDNTIDITWDGTTPFDVSVNYENGGGCTAATPTQQTITVNPLPVPTIGGNTTTCAGTTETYTTEAGMSNYAWVVNGGTVAGGGTATDNTIDITWDGIAPFTVSVNYQDGNNCSAASATQQTITVNALPVPTLGGVTNVCAGDTETYTTEAGMSNYTWVVTGGSVIAGGTATDNTIDITWDGIAPFNVSVNYQDANNCSAATATSQAITVNALPDGTITGNNAVCENTLGENYSVPVGAASYAWAVTSGDATINGAANTNAIVVDFGTISSVIEVTITGAAPTNCVTVSTLNVSVSATSPPPNNGNNLAMDVCQDGALPSLDANASAGATVVNWYSDAALTNQIGSGNPFNPSASDLDMTTVGSTSFYITQDVGCGTSAAVEFVVTVIAKPNAGTDSSTGLCETGGTPVTLNSLIQGSPDAGGTWVWTNDNGSGALTGPATDPTFDPTVSGGGTYTFDYTVTGTGGCTGTNATSTLTIIVSPQPADQTINEGNQSICENATVSISLAGSENGVLYELLLDGNTTGVSATGDGSSNFIVGVLGTTEGLVPAGSPHTITVQASIGGGCQTILTGNVEVDVTATPADQTIKEAGTVTICEAAGQVVTLANSEASVNYVIFLDGAATAQSAVGTGNPDFVVGTLTATDGLTVGTHTITVEASVGVCTTTLSTQIDVTVQDISAPPADNNPNNPVMACQNGPAPTLEVLGTNVKWYKEAALTTQLGTGTSFTPAAADLDMTVTGTTSFFATQDEGCGESTATEIKVTVENCSGCYTVDVNLANATCTDDDGEITLIVGANGMSPFDFEIENKATGNKVTQNGQPNNTFTFSGIASGTYNYLVRDNTACEVTGEVTIIMKATAVTATIEKVGDIACFGDPTGGTARITVDGGVGPVYEYLHKGVSDWTSFTTGEVISGLPVGEDYTIQVRDDANDGCPFSVKISIAEPSAIDAKIENITNTYPEQDVGAFDVVGITSDFPPYDVMLLDGNGDVYLDFVEVEPDRFGKYNYKFEQLPIGSYVTVIRDDSGCEKTLPAVVIDSRSDVTIPNVFTPNNDGVNEAFIILNKKPNTKIVIANRWGVQVYKSDDYQNDWRAEGVPDGIYFYTISMDGQVYNGPVEVWRGGAKINR